MAAGLQLKFIDIAIASKRLVRNSPNLAWITQVAHPIEKYHKILNLEIQDGRRAPIEIYKYFNKGTNKGPNLARNTHAIIKQQILM